jgi:stress response protein YsnF
MSSAGATGSGSAASTGSDQAAATKEIPLYQESVQVGKREVDAGTVHLRKSVKTETVNQPVQLRTETVTIDRQPPADQAASASQPSQSGSANLQPSSQSAQTAQTSQAGQNAQAGQPFQEQDFVIHLKREEPVVQKTVVPAGRIVAQTRTQTQQTNVQAQIRKEEFAVVNEGVGGGAAAGGQSRGADTSSSQSAQASQGGQSSQMITSPTALASADPTTLAGKQVKFSGAKVQQIIDDNLVAIGTDGGQPVFARVHDPVQNLKAGDTVNLTGTVRPMSNPSELGLTGKAADALKTQQIYIDAQKLEPANK